MPVNVEYFTDALCVWAWGGQIRIDELRRTFGEELRFRYRFIPTFADAHAHIETGWGQRGGFEGYSKYLRHVAAHWDHVKLHENTWRAVAPRSSTGVHLFMKAVWLLEQRGLLEKGCGQAGDSIFETCVWRTREAFFTHGRDIANRVVQDEIASDLGLPIGEIRDLTDNGEAHAAVFEDDETRQQYSISGSPTLVLNEGRQLLYGNLGYRILEANVRELLHNPLHGEASWC